MTIQELARLGQRMRELQAKYFSGCKAVLQDAKRSEAVFDRACKDVLATEQTAKFWENPR